MSVRKKNGDIVAIIASLFIALLLTAGKPVLIADYFSLILLF